MISEARGYVILFCVAVPMLFGAGKVLDWQLRRFGRALGNYEAARRERAKRGAARRLHFAATAGSSTLSKSRRLDGRGLRRDAMPGSRSAVMRDGVSLDVRKEGY